MISRRRENAGRREKPRSDSKGKIKRQNERGRERRKENARKK